jgi:hypothetical protein
MIKFKNLINRTLLVEGILDGISPSFIIDSGINESVVKSRKASLSLPRYSLWGFHKDGNGTPKLMENGYNVEVLMKKHGLEKEDVYPIEGSMQETIKKVGKDKFAVYPKKGGKRLGTFNDKRSAENQLKAIEASKKEIKKSPKTYING